MREGIPREYCGQFRGSAHVHVDWLAQMLGEPALERLFDLARLKRGREQRVAGGDVGADLRKPGGAAQCEQGRHRQ